MWPFDKEKDIENAQLRSEIERLEYLNKYLLLQNNLLLNGEIPYKRFIEPEPEQFNNWYELNELRIKNRELDKKVYKLECIKKRYEDDEKDLYCYIQNIEKTADEKIKKLEEELQMYKDFFKSNEVKVYLKDKEVDK